MFFNILIISCLVSLPLPSTGRNQHIKKHNGFHQPKKENVDLDKSDHRHKPKEWKREDINNFEFHHGVENHHNNLNTNKYGDAHGERDRHRHADVQNKPQHSRTHGHQKILNLNQSDHQHNDPSRGKKITHKSGHHKTDSFDERVHRKRTDQNHNIEQVHHKTTKGKSNHHKSNHKSIDKHSDNNIKESSHHQAEIDLNKEQTSGSKLEQKKQDVELSSGKKRRSVGVENSFDNEFQNKPFEYPVVTNYPVIKDNYHNSKFGETGGNVRNEKGYKRVLSSLVLNGWNREDLTRNTRPNGYFSNPVLWESFFKEINSNIDRVIKLHKSHHKGMKSVFPGVKLDHGDLYNNNKEDYNYYGRHGSENKLREVIAEPINFRGNDDLKNKGSPEFPKAFEEDSFSDYEERVEGQLEESLNLNRKKNGKYLQNHRGKPTSSHDGAGLDTGGNKMHHHQSNKFSGHRPNPYYETGFPSLGHFRPNHHCHHRRPFDSAHSPSHQHHSSICKHKHDKLNASGVSGDKENKSVITSHDDNLNIESHDRENSTHPIKELFEPVLNLSTTSSPSHQYAVHETPDERAPSSSYETPMNNSHHVHINQEMHKIDSNNNAASSSAIYFPREETTEKKQEIIINPENSQKMDLKTNSSDICKNGGSIQIPLLNINLPCGDVSVRGRHPDDFYKREFAVSMTNVFHDYVEKQKQEEPLDIDLRIRRRRREVDRNIQAKTEESEIGSNERGGAKNASVFGEIVEVPNDLSKNNNLEHIDTSGLSEYFLEAVDSLDESSLIQVLKDLKDDYLSKSPGDENTVDQVYQKLVSSLLEYKRSNGETDRRRRESPRKARAEAAAILELLAANDSGRMDSQQQDEPYNEQDYNQLDLGPDSSDNPSFLELVSLADKHKSKA